MDFFESLIERKRLGSIGHITEPNIKYSQIEPRYWLTISSLSGPCPISPLMIWRASWFSFSQSFPAMRKAFFRKPSFESNLHGGFKARYLLVAGLGVCVPKTVTRRAGYFLADAKCPYDSAFTKHLVSWIWLYRVLNDPFLAFLNIIIDPVINESVRFPILLPPFRLRQFSTIS